MRGKQTPKRDIDADPKYQSVSLAKFINYVMSDGKKSTAQDVVYDAFDRIEKKTQKNPLEIFDTAMKQVSPSMEVRSRRVGGSNYQVPTPVRGERRFALAARWLLTAARAKKGAPMADRLAGELIAAANNEGDAIKKKDDVLRMAESNRAFAHFARR
ncbi:TPA: 30S ribosomal protein S7 [Candidatus Uhrbacteria bacterium]|nr:MAG: 30S ribosomal protein S7 [Parcubacteria group bacterium GW2011_GWA2_53_21]HBL39416.1 30S ribosomal protein S7 [Candidatus Uhrbacteria bacterium]